MKAEIEKDSPELRCPYCDASDHELVSLFGQTLIGSQYYCNNCRTVFEAVRWVEAVDKNEETNPDGI